jgi:hypothetical protein
MASPDTPKAQTEISGSGLRKIDQLAGQVEYQNSLLDQQTQRLMRRHALTADLAALLAPFVFGSEVAR